MINKFIYWKCGKCNSYHKSDETIRHQMDWCTCKGSAVDAEEVYSRFVGNPIIVTEEEYNKNINENINEK